MYRDKWTPTVDYLDVGKDQVATQGGRSAGFGNKGMVLLFIYDDDAANNSDCVECAGRVAKQTFTTLKNFEVSEVVYASSSDNLKHIIRKLQPECIINASRTVAASILVPKAFTGTNTLAFLHRRWNCEWFGEHYLTVQTIPSSDIIYRDHLGKIPKEASFKLGEWHEAFKAAVLGNLYTVDTKHYQFHIIHTQKQWHSFYKRLKREKIVSIDTETRNLNRIVNDLGTIQFAFDGQTAYVLPFKHPDATWGNFLTSDIIPDLQEYFETTKALHIYANASFDIVQLRRELNLGWYSAGIWDIMRARYCLNENLKYRTGVKLLRSKDNLSGFSLAQITLEYGCNVYSKTAMGKSDRANTFGQPLTHLAEYGGADVVVPFQIYYFQLAEIARRGPSHARIPQVVLNQCKAMSLAFVEMELTGLPIDRAYLSKEAATAGAFNVAKEAIRAELYALPSVQKANRILLKSRHGADLFGRSSSDRWVFSIDTAEHCQLLFFDVLKLEPVTVGKNGQPSLSKAFKSKYAPIGENGELLDTAIQEVALFRDYSEAKHLWSAFIKGFYQKLVSNADMRWDARLRPSFDDLHVVTGRVSARKPSLQQVPSRSKLAKAIKRQFIAHFGYTLAKLDYSAHEIRNLAIASGDETLASAFNVGLQARKDFRLLDTVSNQKEWDDKFKALDLHRQNCQRFYGINPLDVTKEQRTAVKTVVFGTLYGMSATRLAASLNISEEDAQALIDKLFTTFPAMSEYIFKTYEDGALNVQVVSGIGRVRHLWGYLHNSGGVHAAMDRRGPNCVDPETECLTEHGWRTVNKLKIGDKIYTKNLRSGELELQPIRKLFKSKYEGKMWRLDGSIDALVTPNHRWMVDWGRGKFDPACKTRFVTSKDLDDSVDNNPLHLVADSVTKQKGDGSWTDTEASILGWVLTDGHYDKQKGRNGAFISQYIRGNPDKVEVIERLLKRTGETYRRGKPDALGKIRWRIPIALAKRIRKAMPDKTLTVEVLKSLTSKQLTLLYSAMLKGNGSWNSRSKIYSNFAAGTKHKADMFSMLCALVGVPCRVVSRSFPQSKWQYDSMPNVPKPSSECWFVNIKQRDRAQTKFYKSWVDYKGIVWCPNVDNGSFVARRNGSIYITGNSRIQSVSSDQGFAGSYNVQKLRWHFFTSQGIDLGFHLANSVHDSSETLARTEIIPVAVYLMETGYTTMVHRDYRKNYGLEFNVGLEVEVEIGASLSTTKDWNWRADDLRKLTLNSMEWQQSELNYQLDINRTMDAFDYNNELIQKIRKQELRDLPANGVAEHYYFTRDDAKKVKILKPVKRSLLS